MACPKQSEIIDYYRNEASKKERVILRNHISGCPKCRETIAGLNAINSLFQKASTNPPKRIEDRLFGWESSIFFPFLQKRVFAAASAALALVIIGLSPYVSHSRQLAEIDYFLSESAQVISAPIGGENDQIVALFYGSPISQKEE